MEQNKRLLFGIVGSIVGAFLGALPWLLAYAFGNVIVGLLSILIAIGSYYGCKIAKNEKEKNFPTIILLSTTFVVTISIFLIMPIIQLVMNGYNVNSEKLLIIYKNWNIFSAFIFDYIVSLGFALMGAIGIIANSKKHAQDIEKYGKVNTSSLFSYQSVLPEELQKIKNAFSKNNAMTKKTAVLREQIISDLSENMIEARAIQVFNLVRDQQIIRKYKGKFYFSERAQNDQLYRNGRLLIITLIASAVVISAIIVLTMFSNKRKAQENLYNQNTNQNTKTIVEIRENEHIIKDTDLKFIPKNGMMILTDSEKQKYKKMIDYEFIAMNENHTKMLYCFIDNGFNGEELSAREYLEQAFNEDVRGEIELITIANREFQKTNLNLAEADETYIVDCYITKINDKFLCFNYWYPRAEQSNLNEMIEVVENNQ